MKQKDASKLEDEYRRLVEGLQAGEGSGLDGDGRPEDEDFMANPGALASRFLFLPFLLVKN